MSGMKAVMNARPGLLIELSVHASTTIELAVRDRRLDIGLSVSPAHLQSLEYRLAFEEAHALYVSKSAPFYEMCKKIRLDVPLEDTIPVVVRSYDTPGFAWLGDASHFHRAAIADGAESAAAAIVAGIGVGQLPIQLAESVGGGELERLPFPGTPRNIPMYIFWRSDVGRDPAIRTFVDHYGK
jgi:DNA-binding transcriptional LysR family regulator